MSWSLGFWSRLGALLGPQKLPSRSKRPPKIPKEASKRPTKRPSRPVIYSLFIVHCSLIHYSLLMRHFNISTFHIAYSIFHIPYMRCHVSCSLGQYVCGKGEQCVLSLLFLPCFPGCSPRKPPATFPCPSTILLRCLASPESSSVESRFGVALRTREQE